MSPEQLEARIRDLEIKIRELVPGARRATGRTDGCTHGCTGACPDPTGDCTYGCTHGCTNGCTDACGEARAVPDLAAPALGSEGPVRGG